MVASVPASDAQMAQDVLEALNEQLQATNEELETVNEELARASTAPVDE